MKVAIGQDSHKFDFNNNIKKLILGGVVFEDDYSVIANSDGDVILHAITNAISGITCKNVLGEIADEMCKKGIIDSKAYVKEALKYLKEDILHISIAIECKNPKISPKIGKMRESISQLLKINIDCVGITATSGEELSEFGKGNGINCFVCLTVS